MTLVQTTSGVAKREAYFDNLKALLMILVLIGHFMEPLIGKSKDSDVRSLIMLIYSFHMPLFVFVSGVFSKKYDPVKNLKSLFIPFILLQVIWYVLKFILSPKAPLFHLFEPAFTLWYLLALFTWRMCIPYFKNFRYALIVSIIISILAGYDTAIGTDMTLSRIFVFFPYFIIGYYFDQKLIKTWKLIKFIKPTSVLILILIVISIFTFSKFIPMEFFAAKKAYAKFGFTMWYAGLFRLLQYGLTIVLSFCIIILVPSRNLFITFIGRRSLNVYILHAFIPFYLKTTDFYQLYFDSWQPRLLLFGAAIALAFILALKPFDYLVRPLFSIPLEKLFQQKKVEADPPA